MKRITTFLNENEVVEKEFGPDFFKTFLKSKPFGYGVIVFIFVILWTLVRGLPWFVHIIPFAIMALGLIPTFINCKLTRYYLTNQKIIIETGLVGRDYDIVKLDRVLDVNLDVSVVDSILGTGCIKLCTANENELVKLIDVRNPRKIIRSIKL